VLRFENEGLVISSERLLVAAKTEKGMPQIAPRRSIVGIARQRLPCVFSGRPVALDLRNLLRRSGNERQAKRRCFERSAQAFGFRKQSAQSKKRRRFALAQSFEAIAQTLRKPVVQSHPLLERQAKALLHPVVSAPVQHQTTNDRSKD